MQTKPLRSTTSSRTKNTTGAGGRKTAIAKRGFNRRRYAALLAEAVPRIITNVEELKRASRLVEPLLKQGEARTPEEHALCQLLLKLIDDYQTAHPVFPPMKPHEILQALMEEQGLRQADLLDVFGSRSRVSEAVSGKRAISKEQAKKLGERFCLSPAAFI